MSIIDLSHLFRFQNKVSAVTFKSGPSTTELNVVDVVEVDNRFCGWLSAYLPHIISESGVWVVQIELKGPDNSLRVRQIRVLGDAGSPARSFNAAAVHQRTCETETLRVFRLLTSQVFGRLVSYEGGGGGGGEPSNSNHEHSIEADLLDSEAGERMPDNDLKEHMVKKRQ